MTYIVRSSDGREWGDYGTRSEAQGKLRVLRAEKKRSGFKGTFRIVKKRDNPAVNLPRNWVKADAVRVVRKNGRNVLEIKRNPHYGTKKKKKKVSRPKPRKKAARRSSTRKRGRK